jgi:acetoacetyl-CoA reductase
MTEHVAFVTGGMGGLGTAICKRLALDGNKVVANCLPGDEEQETWVTKLRAAGANVYAAEGNVDDYESCAEMMYRIQATVGPISILVNNAGITRDGIFKRMSPGDWYSVINTNLNSVFNVTRQAIEGMMERGWGRIVNISSVYALKGQFGQTNYSAAKAGMHGFTKALAQEVVRKGVTVNTISPGYIDTDAARAVKPEVLQSIVASIPMGRLARPEEIAGLVAYLASDDAGYITGANISINGGLYVD